MSAEVSMLDRIRFVYEGGKTKRFHTSDTLTVQTVADHSFGVAMMVLLIAPRCTRQLLLAALTHDLAEHQVGDMAAPVKRAYPDLKEKLQSMEDQLLYKHQLHFEGTLDEKELAVLKAADYLDGMMYCVRERRMGGQCTYIYNNFKSYVKQLDGKLPPDAFDAVNAIQQLWEKANER